jgi:hypothetical protein
MPAHRPAATQPVSDLTDRLAPTPYRRDNPGMVSPVVIGGFAAIDAALIGQLAYALRDYEKRYRDEATAPRDRHR